MSQAAPTQIDADVLVVGAGLSGLIAARTLKAAGRNVVVVDKGRSVGGRLATRRIGKARLDHGAQFFTVRGDDFRALIDESLASDVVHEWCRGFGEPDGYPRYAGRAGMTSLAKWLARDLDVRTSVRLTHISAADGTWTAATDDGAMARANQIVLTPPVPQTLALLDSGETSLPATIDRSLREIEYFATLALLVTVDGPTEVPEPGGVQLGDGPFTFVAENQRKGISEAAAITFHAEHDYSAQRYNDDPTAVRDELLDMAAPWIGEANVLEAQLKKWLYAGPKTPHPEATVVVDVGGAIAAFAGDAFAGPKVEGAFNSGLAAANALV